MSGASSEQQELTPERRRHIVEHIQWYIDNVYAYKTAPVVRDRPRFRYTRKVHGGPVIKTEREFCDIMFERAFAAAAAKAKSAETKEAGI